MGNYRQYANLVSATQVIAQAFTNENTDQYLISDDVVIITEITHLKPVLGLEYYEELKLQNINGTLTADNQILMTFYLIPALCWLVRFEVVNEIQNNSTSMGIVSNIDEFATAIEPNKLSDYVQDTYRKAKVLLNDMLEFLNHKDQTGLYPTYNANKPNTGSTWKNPGIIMYESNNQYCKGRNYTTWRDYCPSC